jgi:hypothetical protein
MQLLLDFTGLRAHAHTQRQRCEPVDSCVGVVDVRSALLYGCNAQSTMQHRPAAHPPACPPPAASRWLQVMLLCCGALHG